MRKLIKVALFAIALVASQSQAMETESVNMDMDTLVSGISACTLSKEQQFPKDDSICFTIRNETCIDMPVDLQIWLNDRTLGKLELSSFCKIQKYVKGYSESYFRKPECALFRWALDAYKAQRPDNCEFHVNMSFNVDIPVEDFFSANFVGGESFPINPNNVPYGRTYIIRPTEGSFDVYWFD